MTGKNIIAIIGSYFTVKPNCSRRKKLAEEAQQSEQLETRSLLTTIGYTDPSLPAGRTYGDQAEVEFTGQTVELSANEGISGSNQAALFAAFRTTGIGRPATNPGGTLYNTYVLNWDFVKPRANGGTVPAVNRDNFPESEAVSERNIRVTIDETVPFNAAHGREVMRVINLPNQFSARWQRVNENGTRVDLDTENAGNDNQVGRDFEVRTDQTQQFRTVIRNGQNEVVRTIEWRRLTTSNLNGHLSGPIELEAGQNGTVNFQLNNTGNRPYTHGGQVRYVVSTSPQKPTFQQLLNAPNTVSLPNIGVGGPPTTVTDSIPFSNPGTYYIHWVIDTDETPDWRYIAPNGPGSGSGASVLERDSFANRNFSVEPDNNETNSLRVVVNPIPPKGPEVFPPGPTTVSEGTFVSLPFRAIDLDGGSVRVDASLGDAPGTSPNFAWNYDAIDDLGPVSVNLTATDDEGMTATVSFQFTVSNVAPTLAITANSPLEEGGTAVLNGTYFDPGVLDTHTVTIDWGDGSVESGLPVSGGAFSFTHQYSDDNAADLYDATVTIVDKDGGATTQAISIVVTNVAPIVEIETTSEIDENGVATLTGSILDPGTDSFNATIDWGDGTSTVIPLATGTTEFTTTHQYLDDGPSPGNGTSSDDYAVVVTVTDDDGDSGSANAVTTVNNVAPVIRGTPAFSAPQFIVTGTNDILGFDVADIDGDGDLDLASTSRLDNRVAWYPNDGNGNFAQINLQSFDDTIVPRLADIDADGDIDLIASAVDGRSIRLYENDGNQNFTARTILANVRANQLRVADLNGDSTPDIAYGSQDGQLGVLINSGTATFTNQPLMSQLGVVRDIHIDDVDQDGLADIMVAARATSSNSASNLLLLTNTGNFSFQTTTLRSDSGVVFAGVNTLDVDNDGDTDVVGTDETNDAVYLYNNTGGVFMESQLPSTVNGPNFATPSDVDGDGDIDLLVSGVLDDSVSFLRNDGTGTFEEFGAATGIDGARNITVADIDGDGSPEILVDARFGDGIVAFEYLGEQLQALSAIDEGQAATLTAEYFDVGTLDAHKVTVDWGDGNIDTDVPVSNGTINATHVYADDGPTDSYQILVTLTDDDLGVSTASTTIVVQNVAPSAELISISEPRVEGTEIVVTSSASDPGVDDVLIFSYEVLKNGQSFATGEGIDLAEFAFTPDDDATYEIILTVTDNDGGIGTASTIIEVSNVGPVIDLGEDCLIHEGDSVSLDLTRVTDPGNDTISSVKVDWGDGSVETFDTLETVSHVYVDGPADFIIKVTLTDEDGTWTEAAANTVFDYLNTVSSLNSLLIARYQLDGDVSDAAGSADGITVGGAGFVPGLIGDAILADNGVYGHVLPPDAFVPLDDTFSTSLHFNVAAANSPLNWAPLLVMQQNDFNEGAFFRVATTNIPGDTLNLILHGGPKGSTDFQRVTAVFDESLFGEWHQAGYRVNRESGEVSLFLDGQEVATETLTVSSLDPTKGLFIGQFDFTFGRNGHPRFVGGDQMVIDDVLIFSTSLSDQNYRDLSLPPISKFEKLVTVENVAPTPSIDSITDPRIEGTEIIVAASATDPGVDDVLTFSYEVLKNSQSFATGEGIDLTEFAFTPDDDGTYEIILTVTDNDGDAGTISTTIEVGNVGPAIDLGEDCLIHEGDSVSLDLTRITDPGNDTISSVIVDWDDGSVETFDTLEIVSHVYADGPAEFTIKVTLVDEDGTWTADDSLAGYQATLSSLAANTIARYQLEGDASDSAGTANGVLVGAPTFEAGPVGSAISVENGRYAHVLPPDGFVPGNNTFSTSLHFRMDSIYAPLNFAPLLVMQQDDFREGANFAVGTTNERGDTLVVQFDGGGDRQLLSYVAPESLLGSWHQAGYSVDRDNGVLTLVLDGQIVDQQVLTVSSLDSTKGVYIGQYDFSFARNGVPRFIGGEGAIDDVLIFDSALSEAQYESLSLVGSQPFGKIVTVENVAPTPSIDLISEPQAEATEIVVNASATDPALDNDTLTFTYEVLKDGAPFASGSGVDADEFRFTPDDNGEYTVSLTVADEDGGENTVSEVITVTNLDPTANDDVFTVTEDDEFVAMDVLANDTDPAGVNDPLSVVSVATPSTIGTVSITAAGVDYSPNGHFEYLAIGESATDEFSYTIDDGDGGTSTANVMVMIEGVNDAPTVTGPVDAITTEDDPSFTVDLLAGASDIDASDTIGVANFILVSGNDAGIVQTGDELMVNPETYEYLAAGESEVVVFSYEVQDNHGATVAQTATITIIGVNDAPILTEVTSSNYSVESKSDNGWVTVTGSFADTDISDEHTVLIDWGDGTTSSATVDQLGDTFSAMHDYRDGGIYEITVTLDDGNGGIDTQTTQAVVTGTGLVDGVLYIIGSDSKDFVRVRTYHNRIKVQTSIGHRRHNFSSYSTSDVQKVVVITCGASDHIDVLTPGHIPVHVEAGDGRDHVWTANGDDFIDGGNGKDHIWSYGGADTIFAGAGDDHVWSGSGNDVIDAGAGRDNVFASSGNDIVYGREGMDDINAGDGDDIVFGGSGADWLSGDDGNDFIDGGSGNDMIKGGRGHDVLVGGTGRDQIFAGHGNDLLIGGSLSIDWEPQDDLSDVDEAMMAWAAGDLTQTLDLLGNVEDDNTPDKLFGERGYDTILHGRRDWWRY